MERIGRVYHTRDAADRCDRIGACTTRAGELRVGDDPRIRVWIGYGQRVESKSTGREDPVRARVMDLDRVGGSELWAGLSPNRAGREIGPVGPKPIGDGLHQAGQENGPGTGPSPLGRAEMQNGSGVTRITYPSDHG